MEGREIRLAGRPWGEPTRAEFDLARVEAPDPVRGQVRVRNLVMSVDPYMRGRMNEGRSYVSPFQVGEPLSGGAVGEVVASESDDLAVGDVVVHEYGWRDYAVQDAVRFQRVDATLAPPEAYLSVLGMPGMTAYVGLLDIAGMHEGDVVFVSGAAGIVGGTVGQIAKLRGASRVIGSAGSAEKVRYTREELGFDEAFDYHDGRVADLLETAAPEGVDVYFDNVGGEHLEAALGAMRDFGRAALCGQISVYNATEPPPGPRTIPLTVTRRLTLKGFLVRDHEDRRPDFVRDVGGWLAGGKIHYRETVRDGLETAPDAFIGLLRGENVGKMLVRISS